VYDVIEMKCEVVFFILNLMIGLFRKKSSYLLDERQITDPFCLKNVGAKFNSIPKNIPQNKKPW